MLTDTAVKKKTPDLKFAHVAPDVWKTLGALKRTGWVRRGVTDPESVQEHIISLRDIAASLDGLSVAEKDGLLDMLEVHDWPEAIHGDEVVVSDDDEELRRLKAAKFINEKIALETICKDLGEKGKEIMTLWLRFESAGDDAAKFAKQLDKYQAVEKALTYEREQGISLYEEFLRHSRKLISHPILLKKIQKLEQDFAMMTQKLPPEIFAIYFSPYTAHAILLEGKLFPTVEHAYQCQRYTDEKIIEEIREQTSPVKAWEVSSRYKHQQIPQFKDGEHKLGVMKELMRLKITQHDDVRRALLDSGKLKIVKHIMTYPPGDGFWDDGVNGEGLDHIGKMWMELRSELKRDS